MNSVTPADNLCDVVRERALAHGLKPEIVMAVCEQESGWNTYAVRFEPAFEEKYIKPILDHMPPTEALTRAMSFGLMQIMGQVARELGFKEPFLTQLVDPFLGAHYGCLKLVRCYALASGEDVAALLHYNGGSNPKYAAEVLARVPHYQ